MTTDSVRERLNAVIGGQHFEWRSGGAVEIVEKDPGGRGTLTVVVPERPCVFWKIASDKPFKVLKEASNSDGLIFVHEEEDRWQAHVVELKTSLTYEHLDKGIRQLTWSWLRARALAGLLDIKLPSVHFHLAFTNVDPSLADPTRFAIGANRPPAIGDEVRSQGTRSPALPPHLVTQIWRDKQVRLGAVVRTLRGEVVLSPVQLAPDHTGRIALG